MPARTASDWERRPAPRSGTAGLRVEAPARKTTVSGQRLEPEKGGNPATTKVQRTGGGNGNEKKTGRKKKQREVQKN